MTTHIITWIPHLLIAVVLLILLGMLYIFRFTRKGRRSPLTRSLLRSPGESLRVKIENVDDDLNMYLMGILVIPVMGVAVYTSQVASSAKATELQGIVIGVLLAVGYCLVKLWALMKIRADLRLGLDCELAVGQELNHLMQNGCRVYHDFPADNFNIDHVVVGSKGVFAVETKGRAKPDKKGGVAEATVIFDGEALRFPNGTEKGYLDQAKRQAVWLSKWLSSAAGESLSVQPVLALPGWFIQRDKPSDMLIFNGKNPDLLLKWGRDDRLSEQTIKRIVHQIDQRCRDVEPVAYSKK